MMHKYESKSIVVEQEVEPKYKSNVFMCSGMGSQYFGMGRSLYNEDKRFRFWMNNLDRMVQKIAGRSVLSSLYKLEQNMFGLDDLIDSSLSIIMIEYAIARTLIERGIEPDYIIGASLGEISAVAVSGGVPIEEIFQYTYNIMRAIEDMTPQGNMISIIHNIDFYYSSPKLYEYCEVAAVYFDHHFVVSLPVESLETVQRYLSEKKILYQILPVRRAFHSSWIDTAQYYVQCMVNESEIPTMPVPILSCTEKKMLSQIDIGHFWRVIRKPIAFWDTICSMDENFTYNYIDIGPSGTLSTFIKYCLPKSASRTFEIVTPFHQELKNLSNLISFVKSA